MKGPQIDTTKADGLGMLRAALYGLGLFLSAAAINIVL